MPLNLPVIVCLSMALLLAAPDGTAILVLQNFHRFLQSAEIVQALARQTTLGKQNRTFVVILSPVVQIPIELEKLFVVLEHELPSREQLAEIARGIATEDEELPDGSELETVLDAAAGLTRHEAENAFIGLRRSSVTTPINWLVRFQDWEFVSVSAGGATQRGGLGNSVDRQDEDAADRVSSLRCSHGCPLRAILCGRSCVLGRSRCGEVCLSSRFWL